MQLIAENYSTSDGRVNYRKFCDLMEHGKTLCVITDFTVSLEQFIMFLS